MTERAYRYRFFPTPAQENLLRRTMGCVRLVYNKALATRTIAWYERQERIDYKQTSSLLTGWKKTEELNFLNDVSCVPLQQCLRHLQKAFANFWGKRAKYPRFKAKRNGGSAEFTKSAFNYRNGSLWLAKCKEPLNIVWSRLLPAGCQPSTVTVKLDKSGRWFVCLLVDDYTIETLPRNHCGYVALEMPLDVRTWDCLRCGTTGIDRDINAGKNILAAGLAVIVCGADVRPNNHSVKGQLRKTPRGRKQKPK